MDIPLFKSLFFRHVSAQKINTTFLLGTINILCKHIFRIFWLHNSIGDYVLYKWSQTNRLRFCRYCTEDGPTFSLCRFAELSLIPSSVLYGRYLLCAWLPTYLEIRSPFWVRYLFLESEKTTYLLVLRDDGDLSQPFSVLYSRYLLYAWP